MQAIRRFSDVCRRTMEQARHRASKLNESHALNKMTIPQLLERLDVLYDAEESLKVQLAQNQDDIELLQNIILHQGKKRERWQQLSR